MVVSKAVQADLRWWAAELRDTGHRGVPLASAGAGEASDVYADVDGGRRRAAVRGWRVDGRGEGAADYLRAGAAGVNVGAGGARNVDAAECGVMEG